MIRDLIIGGAAIPIALASFDLQPDRRVKGGSLKPVHIAGIEDDVLAELQGSVEALDKAKGNIVVGDGTDWIVLVVGSNDQVLTADSGEVSGMRWADTVLRTQVFS